MKKKLLVLMVIVISLIAIGAVASQENVSDDVNTADADSVNPQDDVVGQPDTSQDKATDNTVKSSSDDKVKGSDDVISITVTKIWDDEENNSTRPNGIDIVLLADGKEVDKVYLTSEYEVSDGMWVYTFENVPKYDGNNKEIEYNVQELNVAFYSSEIMKNSNSEFMIINTYSFGPEPTPQPEPQPDDVNDDSNSSDDSQNNTTPVKKDTNKKDPKKVTKHTKTKPVTRTVVTRQTGNPVIVLILVAMAAVFVPLRRR